MVQQVMRMAVAVSAHNHQGNEGGQENGGQHPNSHNHHRLHGDFGSHGGFLVGRETVQSGSADCLGSITDVRSSIEERVIGSFSVIGCNQRGSPHLTIILAELNFC